MASRTRRGARPLPRLWLPLLLVLVLATALPRGGAVGLKLPFSPGDVLPILPRQVAWPVMNTLHSAVDLLPSFVAAVAPAAPSPAVWNGSCFAANEAALELTPGAAPSTSSTSSTIHHRNPANHLVSSHHHLAPATSINHHHHPSAPHPVNHPSISATHNHIQRLPGAGAPDQTRSRTCLDTRASVPIFCCCSYCAPCCCSFSLNCCSSSA